MAEHWRHVWQSSEILGDYLTAHGYLFNGCTVLELGSGCTGIPGLIASKCGAKLVIFTDHPESDEAFKILEKNCTENGLQRSAFAIKDLNWNSSNIDDVLCDVQMLDYILAADAFYDPIVFKPLVQTIAAILRRYPKAICIFAYELRDSNWSIEDLLLLNNLYCRRIRSVDTDLHTIDIGIIMNKTDFMEASRIFAGIEGGATHCQLVLIDETGKRYGEWTHGALNSCLEGVENSVDRIARWIKMAKKEVGINGPLAAVGMGLSGAENDLSNQRFIDFMKEQHGDIAVEFMLASDAVVALTASFEKGGVVLIAGTGSTCRLLKADGSVCGVGGWGHQIGDGGSAFWIARRIIKRIFDDDDGLHPSCYPTAKIKQLFLDFFGLTDKTGILELLYTNFEKSKIASFTAHVAIKMPDDPLVRQIFHDAGEELGLHVRAISRNFDEEMFDNTPLLLIGSVWRSWDLLKDGFIGVLRGNDSHMKQLTMYTLTETPALGAALLAAKKLNRKINCQQTATPFEIIKL